MKLNPLALAGFGALLACACRARPAGDACTATVLGLGPAAARVTWAIPEGCARDVGDLTIRSEDELRTKLRCGASSQIDFTKYELHVTRQMLSPAAVGVDFFDDGKTLTTVSRQRCPSGPAPMPVTLPFAYLLPVGSGPRAAASTVCLVEGACP